MFWYTCALMYNNKDIYKVVPQIINTLKNKNSYKGVHTISKETLTINIDSDLKLELKVLALRQGKTVTDILNDMIVEYIEKNK